MWCGSTIPHIHKVSHWRWGKVKACGKWEKSELYLVSLKAETFVTEVWYLTIIPSDSSHCQGIFIGLHTVEILFTVSMEDSDFLRNTQSEGNVALTEGGTCHRNYIQNKRNWEILNGVSFINPYPAFWLLSYGTFFSLCGFSIVLFQMLPVCLHFFWLTVSILFNMMVRLIHAGWLYPKQEQK